MCGMSNNNIRLHELVGSLKLLCVEPEWIHESLNMSEHAVIKIPSHPPVLFFLLPTVKMQEVQQQVHEGDTKSRGHRCWCWPRGTMCILESERRCVHQRSQVFDHHPIATKNPKSQKRKPHVPHALQIIAPQILWLSVPMVAMDSPGSLGRHLHRLPGLGHRVATSVSVQRWHPVFVE